MSPNGERQAFAERLRLQFEARYRDLEVNADPDRFALVLRGPGLDDIRVYRCTYDECLQDQDCGTGMLCLCSADRSSRGVSGHHRCIRAGCHVDANCGPCGSCSPVYACLDPVPSNFMIDGYFCHTPGDACVDQNDCPDRQPYSGHLCAPSHDGRWICEDGDNCAT